MLIFFLSEPPLDISDYNLAKLPQRSPGAPTKPSAPPGISLEVKSNNAEGSEGELIVRSRLPPEPLPPNFPEDTDFRVFDAVPNSVLQRLKASYQGEEGKKDKDMMQVRRLSKHHYFCSILK